MTELVSRIGIILERIATLLKEILWSWMPCKSGRPSKERKKPPKKKRLRSIMSIII